MVGTSLAAAIAQQKLRSRCVVGTGADLPERPADSAAGAKGRDSELVDGVRIDFPGVFVHDLVMNVGPGRLAGARSVGDAGHQRTGSGVGKSTDHAAVGAVQNPRAVRIREAVIGRAYTGTFSAGV